MNEADLHFFIDSTINYFDIVTHVKPETGIPYLYDGSPIALEYTGIIGVSGKRKGSIYLTATDDLLDTVANTALGIENPKTEDYKDLIGEITNTISGNVRQAYGDNFLISVPVVIEGVPKDIKLPPEIDSFVIPMKWDKHQMYLVVCLEQSVKLWENERDYFSSSYYDAKGSYISFSDPFLNEPQKI